MIENDLYTYRAIVRSVYDGDTIRADWDLGAGIWLHNEPFRLYRINAPEVRGEQREAGLRSRDALRSMVLGRHVLIRTVQDKKGKYGRFLADIYLDGNCVNDLMVEGGYALYHDY